MPLTRRLIVSEMSIYIYITSESYCFIWTHHALKTEMYQNYNKTTSCQINSYTILNSLFYH